MTATLDREDLTFFSSPCITARCAYGTICTCAFYAGWTIIWPTHHTEPVSVQLHRRRAASWRCPRMACGRRDPVVIG